MDERLPEGLLTELNRRVSLLMGLHFSESRLGDLERGMGSAAPEFGFPDALSFAAWLMGSPELKKEHIEKLASHLTIGETYFFRDRDSFRALEEEVFPALISARLPEKRLRVWSAGCSTGEEAYSIAILLRRLLPDIDQWNISILATDINPVVLAKASRGVYSEWSFRDAPEWLKENYFTRTGDGGYAIDRRIRRMVTFAYLNLAEDAYPSIINNTNAIDVLFCRNVLMYFSDPVADAVLKGFYNSLVEGGWLLLSPAEAMRQVTRRFSQVHTMGAILYSKGLVPAAAAPVLPMEPRWTPAAPEPEPVVKVARKAAEPAHMPSAKEKAPVESAEALYGQGRYAEAARAVEALADGAGTKGMLVAARSYANLGRLSEAAAWCERAIKADTLNPAAYFLLATIRQEEGRPHEAVTNLRKAIYLDQDFIVVHFMLGNLLLSSGEVNGAERHHRVALELLARLGDDEALPESEGMTAGRLREIIGSMRGGRCA